MDGTPCKDCGVVPENHVEYDTCSYCAGTGRDEIGNDCIFCEHGERTIEEWVCACDPYGDE